MVLLDPSKIHTHSYVHSLMQKGCMVIWVPGNILPMFYPCSCKEVVAQWCDSPSACLGTPRYTLAHAKRWLHSGVRANLHSSNTCFNNHTMILETTLASYEPRKRRHHMNITAPNHTCTQEKSWHQLHHNVNKIWDTMADGKAACNIGW